MFAVVARLRRHGGGNYLNRERVCGQSLLDATTLTENPLHTIVSPDRATDDTSAAAAVY